MDILFRCDNIVVYKYKNMKIYGTSKISVYEKQQKIKLDVAKLPYVSKGSRVADSIFIKDYLCGHIKIDDIVKSGEINYA